MDAKAVKESFRSGRLDEELQRAMEIAEREHLAHLRAYAERWGEPQPRQCSETRDSIAGVMNNA